MRGAWLGSLVQAEPKERGVCSRETKEHATCMQTACEPDAEFASRYLRSPYPSKGRARSPTACGAPHAVGNLKAPSFVETQPSMGSPLPPGLSYRASRGLLVGVLGGQAGSLVHYALYEPGRVL
jgi:hypothetical protein